MYYIVKRFTNKIDTIEENLTDDSGSDIILIPANSISVS